MSKPFSSHEFFIEEGQSYRIEVEPHTYFRDEDQDKEIENARLLISTGNFEWAIEVSIPKDALKHLVQVARKYLKDGEADFFAFACE